MVDEPTEFDKDLSGPGIHSWLIRKM